MVYGYFPCSSGISKKCMRNHNSHICLNKFFQEALSQLLTSSYWLLLSYKYFSEIKNFMGLSTKLFHNKISLNNPTIFITSPNLNLARMGQRWVAVWDINVVQTKKNLDLWICIQTLTHYNSLAECSTTIYYSITSFWEGCMCRDNMSPLKRNCWKDWYTLI